LRLLYHEVADADSSLTVQAFRSYFGSLASADEIAEIYLCASIGNHMAFSEFVALTMFLLPSPVADDSGTRSAFGFMDADADGAISTSDIRVTFKRVFPSAVIEELLELAASIETRMRASRAPAAADTSGADEGGVSWQLADIVDANAGRMTDFEHDVYVKMMLSLHAKRSTDEANKLLANELLQKRGGGIDNSAAQRLRRRSEARIDAPAL